MKYFSGLLECSVFSLSASLRLHEFGSAKVMCLTVSLTLKLIIIAHIFQIFKECEYQ